MNFKFRFSCMPIIVLGLFIVPSAALANPCDLNEPGRDPEASYRCEAYKQAELRAMREEEEKQKKAEKEQRNKDAQIADYVDTTEIIQLKEIKIGMTKQELLRAYPALEEVSVPLDNKAWIKADTQIYYKPNGSYCGERSSDYDHLAKGCVTIMKQRAFELIFLFVENKLEHAQMVFDTRGNEVNNITDFYNDLLAGLTEKLKAAPKVKDTTSYDTIITNYNDSYSAKSDTKFRTAGWTNANCACKLQISYNNQLMDYNDWVLVSLTADSFETNQKTRAVEFAERGKRTADAKKSAGKKDL